MESRNDDLVLILASDFEGHDTSVSDTRGITTEVALSYLCSLPEGLKIGFFFDYDINMMLKGLHPEAFERLRRTNQCYWKQYSIKHIPRKVFHVQDRIDDKGCTIWDVAGWVQTSFVKLIEKWQLGTPAQRAMIQRMKDQRADFASVRMDKIKRYTRLECMLLCQWMKQLLSMHDDLEICLSTFCGAGSTSSAMLRQAGAPRRVEYNHPEVEQAYFGGRSEISLVGVVEKTVHSYDINSAYPFQISNLPCLSHGTWNQVRRFNPDVAGIWQCVWSIKRSLWGPFPFRGLTPRGHTTSLIYPLQGRGWYHTSEVIAARKLFPKQIKITAGFEWHQTCEHLPFQWVVETANKRVALKEQNDPRAIVLKYGLNSMYGKLAQHAGTGPYQNIFYAGMITAGTRALLLDAVRQAPNEVILLATDGILSTTKLDLHIAPILGAWEYQKFDSAFLIQSGVYWKGESGKSRGVEMKVLSRQQCLDAWQRDGLEAKIPIKLRRFFGYRVAMHWNRPEIQGTWRDVEKVLSFDPRPRRSHGRSFRTYHRTQPGEVSTFTLQQLADITSQVDVDDAGESEQPDWSLYGD